MKSKRKWSGAALATVVSVSLALSGCGNSKVNEGKTGDSPKAGETVKLTFSNWASGPEKETFDKAIAKFETDNPGIKLEQVNVPFAGYSDKIQTMMAGKTAPDIIYMSQLWFQSFAEKNAFMNLQPFIDKDPDFNAKDFHPVLADAGKYKGNTQWIARDLDYLVLYYNKDMFKAANIELPNETWTWDNLLDAAKKLTKDTNNDGKTDQYGFLAPNGYISFPWLWQNGGSVLNKDRNQTSITDPKSVEALQWLGDLTTKYKVSPAPDVMKQEGSSAMFKAGKIGMAAYGHWLVPSLKQEKKFDWGVTLLPKGKESRESFVSGSGYTVSKDTKNQEAAWKFVKYMTGPEVLKQQTDLGLLVPSRQSVYNSDAFNNASMPENKVFVEQTKYLRELPVTGKWNQMLDVVQKEFDLIWMGSKKPEDAAKSIKDQVDPVLKK
jgi:multiple sugar transport system substrate-binding protein